MGRQFGRYYISALERLLPARQSGGDVWCVAPGGLY
jgi:hypothetical protein